ncbi:unnamed protein product [Spirodela intermedia]|uniref:CRAL-TRIO domain-containing protein n=1 Tax=Spirodela intermedia TaxID=51605 RepID=A0A7I8KDL6_SPIIN|nr:unnamed protein product [Spirodela intermedia]
MNSSYFDADSSEGQPITEEKKAKVVEIRKLLGPLPEKLSLYCSDACIARYLEARNWNIKKALKMLKGSLKWRLDYKPEEIRWEEVAAEAETGKIYRTNIRDRHGRSILVMRPGRENTHSGKGQIRYLVYCMENAILNLRPGQSQMVWLIDYDGYKLSNVSLSVSKETAHILQDHYPERLGVAVLYNPPKFFEPFWKMIKPFLEQKTRKKVRFVYTDDPSSSKIMEDVFGMDRLESALGADSQLSFDYEEYANRMREDDKRIPSFWTRREDANGGQAEERTAAEVPPVPRLSESESDDSSGGNGVDSSPQRPPSGDESVDEEPPRAST